MGPTVGSNIVSALVETVTGRTRPASIRPLRSIRILWRWRVGRTGIDPTTQGVLVDFGQPSGFVDRENGHTSTSLSGSSPVRACGKPDLGLLRLPEDLVNLPQLTRSSADIRWFDLGGPYVGRVRRC